MALLTSNSLRAGTTNAVTLAAASAGGDTVAAQPGRKQFLHVKNASAGALTVTVTAQRTSVQVGGETYALANLAIAVAAAAERLIPLTEGYIDAGGLFNITYSGVTSLTVGAVDI